MVGLASNQSSRGWYFGWLIASGWLSSYIVMLVTPDQNLLRRDHLVVLDVDILSATD